MKTLQRAPGDARMYFLASRETEVMGFWLLLCFVLVIVVFQCWRLTPRPSACQASILPVRYILSPEPRVFSYCYCYYYYCGVSLTRQGLAVQPGLAQNLALWKLTWSSKCWAYRYVPAHLASFLINDFLTTIAN